MRTTILVLGVLFVAVVLPAQSYKYGEMIKSETETRSYHGVTKKIVVYRIRQSMTIYTVTQGTSKPSELASEKLVEFRFDDKNKSVMYVKEKDNTEVKYSVISTTSFAR
jgi:hypothetical protein